MVNFSDTVAGVTLTSENITGTTGVLTSNSDFDLQSGTVDAIIAGFVDVNKTTSGTVTLSKANTYSGATTINSGTLIAAAANALGGTSQIVVNTAGSLLVAADDSVNNSAGVTLAGGSLAFSGNRSETLGALTLSSNSTLDFGTESVVAIFSSLAMNGYALNVYNWTGTTLWNGGIESFEGPLGGTA
jgi:fibronectin-binding autotransporter adhesin